MGETANIIIADTFQGLGTDAYTVAILHTPSVCQESATEVQWRGARALRAGDLMIVRKGKLVEKIQPSEDFRVKVIYIVSGFVVPEANSWNNRHERATFPISQSYRSLTTEQQKLCLGIFEQVEYRLRIQTIISHRDYAYRLHTDVDTRLLRFPPIIWRGQYLCTKCFHHEPFPSTCWSRTELSASIVK